MRLYHSVSMLIILLCVSLTSADLREPHRYDPEESAIAPQRTRSYFDVFLPNETARAQVSGNGASCLGLYVFDPAGNCVALDDVTGAHYCDELFAEWTADAVGRYSVELRSGGFELNKYTIVIR